jgi:hypothetical protein
MDEEQAKQLAIKDGEDAWLQASSGNWNQSTWSRMGAALTLFRTEVLQQLGMNKARGGKYNDAFNKRIASTKFATMHPVTRSNTLFLMEPQNRVVLDALMAKWTPDLRARRTHPITLAKYVKAELNPPKPKPAPKAAEPTAKAAPLTDPERRKLEGELLKVRMENDELREKLAAALKAAPPSALELKMARNENDMLRMAMRAMKSEIAAGPKPPKPPKPQLDPESEAARQIKGLVTKNRNLNRKLQMMADRLAQAGYEDGGIEGAAFSVRGKLALAVAEETTNPEVRMAARKALNGLGGNNNGKR